MKLIARWFIVALSLLLVSSFVPGISVGSFYTALVVALALGLVNALIRPVLIVLTLPVTILSLGLFTFVINAVLFWFVSSFVKGFEVSGFLPALIGSIAVSVLSFIGNAFIRAIDKENDRPL